ncbi:glutathione-dependent formaldehyde-activating protein [Gluconacetobacter sacchari DSM 12717]|nr:glutathione-dependent formaldehyde-activating protein [Gluconacetobacter sacchari DSM 12717]
MEEREVKMEGGCLCGAVRYIAEGEPISSGICHCKTCRRAASAPRLPFVGMLSGGFRYTRGAPVDYTSSPGVTRSFCGRCGSPLTYRREGTPGELDVMTVSLDDPNTIRPTFHVWASEALDWDPIMGGLPSYPGSRP